MPSNYTQKKLPRIPAFLLNDPYSEQNVASCFKAENGIGGTFDWYLPKYLLFKDHLGSESIGNNFNLIMNLVIIRNN
jgi:hypothetical protein